MQLRGVTLPLELAQIFGYDVAHVEVQDAGVGLFGLFAPVLERRGREHVRREPGFEEGIDSLIVDDQIASTGLVSQRLYLLDDGAVMSEERAAGVEFSFDQGGTDEDFAR